MNILVFIFYVVAFAVQDYFWEIQIQLLENYVFIGSLVFLPHGIRVMSIIFFKYDILPGLLFAHIATGLLFMLENWTAVDLILKSFLSVLSIAIAYFLLSNQQGKSEFKINLSSIFLLTILSSVFNSILNSIYGYYFYADFQFQLFTFILGDIIGAILVYFIFYYVKYFYKRI